MSGLAIAMVVDPGAPTGALRSQPVPLPILPTPLLGKTLTIQASDLVLSSPQYHTFPPISIAIEVSALGLTPSS